MAEAVPPIRTACPAVPPPIEHVVLKALAKRPQQRWADAGEFIAALGGI
jgi:hypothetical protein